MTASPLTSAPLTTFEPPASLEVEHPPDAAVLVACAVAAVGADLAIRSGVVGLAGAAVPAAVCASFVATRRFANTQAKALLVLAPVVMAFVAWRTNHAVVVPDIVAGFLLVGLAAGMARGGSLFDVTFPGVAGRLALTLTHGLLAPGFLLPLLLRTGVRRARWLAVARAVAIAVPVVVALVALLASADAVFASLLHLPDAEELALHLVLLGCGAAAAAALLRHASARTAELPLGKAPALGRLEVRVVLSGLCGVYAAFAATQLAVAAGAADRILSQEGMTYADYARRGFFQLLAAAGLTAVVLLCLRACGPRDDGVSTALVLAAVTLTEVVVVMALQRLSLYESAYGLTLLRLAAVGAAVWIGIVFVLIGLAAAGLGAGRSWLPGAVVTAALIGLLAWNLADPAALVARRDLDRSVVDPVYLASLGDDAVPTIAARLDGLEPSLRAELVRQVCSRRPENDRYLAAWNNAASRAARARTSLGC